MCLNLMLPSEGERAPAILTTTSDFFQQRNFFLILFHAELASGLLNHDWAGMNSLSLTHWRGEALILPPRFFFLSPRK